MDNTTPSTAKYVDEITLATMFPLSRAWLRKDRITDRILPFIKVGTRVFYSVPAVEAVLAARTIGGPAKPKTKGAM